MFYILEKLNIMRASMTSHWTFAFQNLPELFILLPKYVGICNLADDTATYSCDENLEIISKLFKKNSMYAWKAAT